MVEEKPRADTQKSSGQGAAKWSKSLWLTGDRKQWVKRTNNDQNAQCVWCMELLAAREKHGKAVNLGTSWATSGCTTRKESALISHEISEFHSKAAAAKADALGRLASKQDQRMPLPPEPASAAEPAESAAVSIALGAAAAGALESSVCSSGSLSSAGIAASDPAAENIAAIEPACFVAAILVFFALVSALCAALRFAAVFFCSIEDIATWKMCDERIQK